MIKNKKTLIFSLLLLGLFLLPNQSRAVGASLYLSPSSGSYTVGGLLSVSIFVSSTDQAMNAASAVISFPQDKLEIVSLSKSSSIITLWVQEPSFSNTEGRVEFAGIVLNPGFTGPSGKILAINFRIKTAGSALLTFSEGSVLANDGKGTNILSAMGGGTYNIQSTIVAPSAEEKEEEYVPPAIGGIPAAPVVSSSTHPDPDKWYSNNDPEFSWSLPSDVDGVSIYFSESPTSNPGPLSDGLFSSKSYENVEDGIWYFHIKARNSYGWGAITHRKVLIDTEPPEPFKIIVEKEDITDPRPILYFDTTDALSGIEYYEVLWGDDKSQKITLADLKTNPYKLPPLPPEKYKVLVNAYDKAGNFTPASTEVEILPIETPIITKYPKSLSPDENLVLEGESLPEVIIRVFFQEKKALEATAEETEANKEGKWLFTSIKGLEKGEYTAWVQAKNKKSGALSLPSEKISFEVGLSPLLKFGTIAISYLMIMATLILLIAVAIGIIFYIWYRISLWRKKVSKETQEVAQSVAGAFRALREEVEEQIAMIDKKPGLTKSEKEIRDKLQEALDVSEQFISKEIKDIEKELE